jgi:tetratricopeptide (TPR) repeat protein
MPRLEQLLELLAAEPNDSFLRYGVAMEYAKRGEHDKALAEFNELIHRAPDYVAAYFMAGRTCEQKGEPEEAKKFYQRGIATAQRVGDRHAAGEMSSALMMLE